LVSMGSLKALGPQGDKVVATVDGANAPELVSKVSLHVKSATASPAAAATKAPSITQRIQSLLKSSPVLLFMKGDAAAPRCGFSSKVRDYYRPKFANRAGWEIALGDRSRDARRFSLDWIAARVEGYTHAAHGWDWSIV
jgi:hypothetical protein